MFHTTLDTQSHWYFMNICNHWVCDLHIIPYFISGNLTVQKCISHIICHMSPYKNTFKNSLLLSLYIQMI